MVPTHLWVFDRAVNVSSKEKQEHYLKTVGISQKKGKNDIKCSRLDIFLASDPEGKKPKMHCQGGACKLGRGGTVRNLHLSLICVVCGWPQGHMALRDLNLIPFFFFFKCLVALNPLSQFLSNRSVEVSTLGP